MSSEGVAPATRTRYKIRRGLDAKKPRIVLLKSLTGMGCSVRAIHLLILSNFNISPLSFHSLFLVLSLHSSITSPSHLAPRSGPPSVSVNFLARPSPNTYPIISLASRHQCSKFIPAHGNKHTRFQRPPNLPFLCVPYRGGSDSINSFVTHVTVYISYAMMISWSLGIDRDPEIRVQR